MLYTNQGVEALSPVTMPLGQAFVAPIDGARPTQSVTVRSGTSDDLDALVSLERRTFYYNCLARRSFARFLSSPQASLLVADHHAPCTGYALVLFRVRSQVARIYSIAVDRDNTKRGIATMLLRAVEDVAAKRGSKAVRLEVREDNDPAINLYCKLGYRVFGYRSCYYDDDTHALRLSRNLTDIVPN